jgi:aminoglycoside phosphotransferase (APT) family kinase protein
MRWIPDGTESSLRAALAAVAPELTGQPMRLPSMSGKENPEWHSGAARLGDFMVKFAWSEIAARRLANEIAVLTALSGVVPYLPQVVASSVDPVMLVTRREPGTSLFQAIDGIDIDQAGAQLATFLTALHDPATLRMVPDPATPRPPTATAEIRPAIGRWLRAEQRPMVDRWCDWTDTVLADRRPAVLAHGDLHGDNQVWQGDRLRLVVDFETAGAAEPEFDLRALPGTGPGVELLLATVRHYGRPLSLDRVLAWHIRTALADVLWRSEAGIHLPDHRTPPDWVDDIAERVKRAGVTP